MKFTTQISSIIVALLFIYTINFKSFVTFGHFINEAEIIELFCINKEETSFKCDGKCHLAAQFSQVETDTEKQPFSPSSLTYNLEITYIVIDTKIVLQNNNEIEINQHNTELFQSTHKGHTSINSPPPKA